MTAVRIAIVTFEGFNELDSLIACHLFGRLGAHAEAALVAPTAAIRSMHGLLVHEVRPLEWSEQADVVLIGSGRRGRAHSEDAAMLRLRLDPTRQLIGSQCSGALILQRLGLLHSGLACTDTVTRPLLEARGVTVLEQPLHVQGNVATAGGCLASQYLACWAIARTLGVELAKAALDYVAPVGEKAAYVERMLQVLETATLMKTS